MSGIVCQAVVSMGVLAETEAGAWRVKHLPVQWPNAGLAGHANRFSWARKPRCLQKPDVSLQRTVLLSKPEGVLAGYLIRKEQSGEWGYHE